ncbi:hypothetical protein IGI04_012230 [Brassica rapa subsp. trilocularis]|uniref:Uncharacterized protein n=1 Tax=Brassica rapa subsp. trilocularis TaxID=1813537 RepID=A0ABQ7N5C1_BRACM|nr:hypothetical protein IGI04_012230 [Brassica rapa subsp. trilocularis]
MKWDYRRMKLTNEKLSFKGNDRRLKYIGKKNRERFLILTSFSRRVSNVLSIPSDPLIPCEYNFRIRCSGFLFVNPSSLRNTTPQKLLKLLKPVVE